MIQLKQSNEATVCASNIYLIDSKATEISGLTANTIAAFQANENKFE